MKKEISQALSLTDQQVALLYSHSYLNILNILTNDLTTLAKHRGNAGAFQGSRRMLHRIKNTLDDIKLPLLTPHQIQDVHNFVEQEIAGEFREALPSEKDQAAVDETINNIRSLFRILYNLIRVRTYHPDNLDTWVTHSISDIKRNIEDLLTAIETNSRGSYRIVDSQTHQEENEYLFTLTIESPDNNTLFMPPVLQDCMRDLIANARKYTSPGGQISALLSNDGQKLVLEVRDDGRGIPEQEIDRVVHFGYRGKNSGERTQGGGFGLTKACYITQKMGGRMWIDSVPEKGTVITLKIPIPEAAEDR